MSVIVVGSGIGGLSAAESLAKAGRNVIVLEANNVLGGRLCTQNVNVGGGNFAYDLGASWIHGSCLEHPITQLSKEMTGVKTIVTDDDKMVVYNMRGQDVSDAAEKAFQAYEGAFDQLEDEAGDNESMEQVIRRVSAQALRDPMIMYHVANDMEFQTSGSISTLSAKYGNDDEQFEGDEALIVSGYQKFCQHIADKNKLQVHLNHKVVSAEYNEEEEKTFVKCQNGKVFDAEYVVWNVPIGVLKKKAIQFTPSLEAAKQTAVDRIGFGNVCKVLVVFKKVPYTNKQHYIGVIADNTEDRGLFTYFLNIYGLAELPAIMTFGLGAAADRAEIMSEQQAKQLIAQRLSAFSQNTVSPNDFNIYRTNWRTNQNFNGAYSYAAVNTKEEDWEEMARPMYNQGWYFCGEHTTHRFRGTVHGAWLTGQYAAQDLLDDVNAEDWVYLDALAEEEGEGQEQGEAEEPAGRIQAPIAASSKPKIETKKLAAQVASKMLRKPPVTLSGIKKKPAPIAKAGNNTGPAIQGNKAEACCSTM